MRIKTIHKQLLRNMEHYQFAIHVLEMAKEANLEKMKLLFKPLEEAIRHEDEALNPPRIDPATEELRLRDAERDRAYRSLQLAIEMGLLAEESATKEAAKKLREIISRYPGVLTADYDSETGALKNLLADLKPADAASALTALGATAIAKRLEDTNAAFDGLFRGRFSGAKPTNAIDLKARRAATDAAVNAIVRRMDSLDDLEPSADVSELINRYNQLVDNRHTLLSQRATLNKAAHERKIAGIEAMLIPLIPAFEREIGSAPGSLSFTGEVKGSGKDRRFKFYDQRTKVWTWGKLRADGTLAPWVAEP